MSIKTKNQIFIDRLGRIDAQQIAHQIYHQIQNSSSPGDNCSPKNSHDYPDPLMIFDTVCELLNHISARNFSKKKPQLFVFDILNYICQTRDTAARRVFSTCQILSRRRLLKPSAVA